MNPVSQTKFGPIEGNCLQACIATMFDLPIEDVPDFGARSDWYDRFTDFMVQRFGVQPIDVSLGAWYGNPRGLYIASGPSPRGDFDHSVILSGGKLAHDPYPGGTGLDKYTSFTFFVKVIDDDSKKSQ